MMPRTYSNIFLHVKMLQEASRDEDKFIVDENHTKISVGTKHEGGREGFIPLGSDFSKIQILNLAHAALDLLSHDGFHQWEPVLNHLVCLVSYEGPGDGAGAPVPGQNGGVVADGLVARVVHHLQHNSKVICANMV